MTARRRWMIIGGLLVATLSAVAWVRNAEDTESGISAEVPARTAGTAPAAPAPAKSAKAGTTGIDLDRLVVRTPGTPQRDPFALPQPKIEKRVARTGARAPIAPPPAPPSAPPVPFTYMGKLRSGSDTAVFLTQGDRNLVLREGDTIDSTYRVEQIADRAITLVYLPLDERQTIVIGEPPP